MSTVCFICDVPCAVFVDGAETCGRPVSAPANGTLTASVLPAIDDVPRLSYTVMLCFEHDTLTRATGGAQILFWGKGVYEVILSPPALPFRHTPITLAQSGNGNLATLYDDGELHLMCEGSGFFVHDVPRLIEYTLTSSNHGEFIAVLQGRTAQKEYFLAVSLRDEGSVLHEHLAERIEPTERGVTVTESLADMKRRKRITTYASGGQILSRSFQRTERAFPHALLPYAFLEAVHARDSEDVLSFVSAELADAEAISEFFGEFDVICQPKPKTDAPCVAVYSRRDGTCAPRLFSFTLEGRTITAIDEISIS